MRNLFVAFTLVLACSAAAADEKGTIGAVFVSPLKSADSTASRTLRLSCALSAPRDGAVLSIVPISSSDALDSQSQWTSSVLSGDGWLSTDLSFARDLSHNLADRFQLLMRSAATGEILALDTVDLPSTLLSGDSTFQQSIASLVEGIQLLRNRIDAEEIYNVYAQLPQLPEPSPGPREGNCFAWYRQATAWALGTEADLLDALQAVLDQRTLTKYQQQEESLCHDPYCRIAMRASMLRTLYRK